MTLTLPIPARVRAAFGADRSAAPQTWAWTDMSDDLFEQQTALTRGQANESAQIQPAGLDVEVENDDGEWTPRNPMSSHWPNVKTGTPLDFAIKAGPAHLDIDATAGARARTPDHASLDVTTAFFAKIELTVPWWPLGGSYKLVGKFASVNRSWVLFLTGSTIGLLWSTDGAATGELSATSTLPLWMPASGRLVLGVKFVGNNGASGRTITFYNQRRWTDPLRVHEAITQSGTTSIFSGTSPLDIGDVDGSGFNRPMIEVHRFELRSGDETGTVVARPDFTVQTPGATSFADTAAVPKTWTLAGAAALSNWQTRHVLEIADIRPSWTDGDQPGSARVGISAAGATRRMGQGAPALESPLRRLATSAQNIANVIGYWPCEDGAQADRIATPIPGAQPMGFGGELQFATDSALLGSKPVMSVSGGQAAGWSAIVPVRTGLTNWACEFYTRLPSREADPASTTLGFADSTGTVKHWRLALSDTNFRISGTDDDGGSLVNALFSSSGFTGNWTNVRLTVTQNGGNVDWDITFYEVGGSTVFGTSGSVAGTVGRPTQWRTLDTAPADGWSFAHLVFTTNLAGEWLTPADQGWPGEAAAERMARLGGEEGVPISIYGDRATSAPMGVQGAKPLLTLLEECAAADLGVFCEQERGLGLAYRTRETLYNQEPALTLDVATQGFWPGFGATGDDQRFHNDVTVTRDNGSSYRKVDPAVEAQQEPRYKHDVPVNVASDTQLPDLTGWHYLLGTWPEMRYPAVPFDLVFVDDLVEAWLTMILGDVLRVEGLPHEHPTDAIDLLLEHASEAMSTKQWAPALTCSPAGPWTVGVLDGDGTPNVALARLDTGSSELGTGIDDDDTGLSVATTTNPLWTTGANQRPFGIVLAGEEADVTNLTGASSPQTFTVTRSANGIEKSHDAGTAVNVAEPFRLAL